MRMTMKKIIWMQAVLLTGLAAMWGCGGDDTTDEQPAVMPQVNPPCRPMSTTPCVSRR